MYKLTLFVLIVSVSIVSCKTKERGTEKEWSDLPGVTRLDSLEKTDFVATLENPIDENRNTIYAPSLLYAWDTIKKILNGEVLLNSNNSNELKLLTKSTSYKNALTDSEYSIDVKVQDDIILARAFFNKTLPFSAKLQKANTMMLFDKKKVKAFGMYYFDEAAVAFSDILYYAGDENFILRLTPKDSLHEILLVKGLKNITTLAAAVDKTNELIKLGKRAEMLVDDIYSIPEISFNIETNYKQLEEQVFYIGDDDKFIEAAYQRTGFVLNETGAVVESEAIVAVTDTAGPLPSVEKPKRMIFDQPFYIIIKRKDAVNPYFVIRVANAELMRKE